MAGIVLFKAMLGRMGFNIGARDYISGANEENVNSLEQLERLTDEGVETLCKAVRKPGGVNAAGAAVPGNRVSVQAQNNLTFLCYYLRYLTRVSRTTTEAAIQLNDILKLCDLRTKEKDFKDPTTVPEIDEKDWPKTMEIMKGHIEAKYGCKKTPLGYLIRDVVEPPPEADDPSTNYRSREAELVARCPHQDAAGAYTDDYNTDNTMLFNWLQDNYRDTVIWTYIRQDNAQRDKDGRKAWFNLTQHYLGENHVNNMATAAEHKMATATYKQESRNWTFAKYEKLHTDQANILNGLKKHGHAGIDDGSRVRLLMSGIKTTKYDAVKAQILASPTLRTDYKAVVNLYQDYIRQMAAQAPDREVTIAAVKTGKGTGKGNGKRDHPDVEPDMSVDDRYYKKSEYNKLSHAKKLGLKLKREKRGHTSGGGDNKTKSGNFNFRKLAKRDIKAIASQVAKHSNKDDEPTDSESDSSESPEPAQKRSKKGSNRNHKALKRKQ
jgi:hypothetical protein